MKLEKMFAQSESEYRKFASVESKRSRRPDLHAFLLLDELCPSEGHMVQHASKYEIFLAPDVQKLEKVITQDQVTELVRCGVRYDAEFGCLMLHV